MLLNGNIHFRRERETTETRGQTLGYVEMFAEASPDSAKICQDRRALAQNPGTCSAVVVSPLIQIIIV